MARDEWFRRWFGREYLELYPHRDREEARRGVELFLESAGVPAGARVLDIGCGAGRHLAALREAGREAVGVDLSVPLLRRAREDLGRGSPVACGDMRHLPVATGSVDGVTSYFTSFGYFDTPSEDRHALREMRRVLRSDGAFLLDYLNAEQVRSSLVPREVTEVRGRRVRQERRIEGDRVVKRIEIEPREADDGADGSPRVYHERVRLYGPDELEELLRGEGLRPRARFGGYGGESHGPGSPRLILVGRAD